MNGTYLVLLGVGLLGMLPLAVILFRKRRVDEVLRNGLSAMATVEQVYPAARYTSEVVVYRFQDINRQQYKGKIMTGVGQYKPGDTLEIFYLQDHPKRNTVKGAWKSKFILGFGIVIALVIWFMVYKIYEMVRDGQI